MKNRDWASLSLATAMLFGASAASATLVQATAQSAYTSGQAPLGSFNFQAYCFGQTHCSGTQNILLVGSPAIAGSFANFIFDTDLGVLSHNQYSETLTWNTAMGTPSPLVSGTFTVSGIFNYSQDLSDATSFSITRSYLGLSFSISGVDYEFNDTKSVPNVPAIPGVYSLAEAFNPPFDNLGFVGYGPVRNGQLILGSQYQHIASLNSLPIPEPSTWGLLIMGFAGAGSTLRLVRSRRVGLAS